MPKQLKGVVVSDKMAKTLVVEVAEYKKHPKYQKYVKKEKRYKAHNENAAIKAGDKVIIEECRPISKDKHFRIVHQVHKVESSNLETL